MSQPVTVDEFRIAVAETYDVLVEPEGDRAYTIFAEAMDRSGYARGTLAPREGLSAPIPEMRPRPLLTMADMGMAHGPMSGPQAAGMDHGGHTDGMHGMEYAATDKANEMTATMHGPDDHGPGSDMIAMMPTNRLSEPGIGLETTDRRVLVYTDLRNSKPGYDLREPTGRLSCTLPATCSASSGRSTEKNPRKPSLSGSGTGSAYASRS